MLDKKCIQRMKGWKFNLQLGNEDELDGDSNSATGYLQDPQQLLEGFLYKVL